MQKLVFPMRESMPYFVCSLRQVDEWKRFQARQSQVFTQAAYDVNAKYVKSPFAKSLKIEDLLRFLDDTALDIEFMVQLPSIEKCLDQWWKIYAKDKPMLDAEQFRQVYYDLANVLVQAKTENTHKNSVSMIMRASWTKWSPKEVPLAQPEFFRLLFVLAHLMTETNALGDYVTFFQETLAKITRMFHIKAKRSEQRKRKPRTHRKSSIVEIMGRTGSATRMRTASVPSQVMMLNQVGEDSVSDGAKLDQHGSLSGTPPSSSSSSSSGGGHGTVNVSMRRVLALQSRRSLGVSGEDDMCADRFVEVLDRRGVYSQRGAAQHVVVDPLVFERQFQDKWKRPAHARTLSTEEVLRELHPVSNKYVPPLCIARLHTSPPSQIGSGRAGIRGLLNRHCQSTPALTLKASESSVHKEEFDLDAQLKAALAGRDEREDDVLRRSLSAVTLKKRIEHNKAHHAQQSRAEKVKGGADDRPAPIYLAIST